MSTNDKTQNTEAKKDYKAQIADLLSNYEDGWDIFKKADDWDYPVKLTAEAEESGKSLPQNWLELTECVLGIIAKEKYDLNTRVNNIEIITSEQMLDAYTSVGMPVIYDHWSFGKSRIQQEEAYKKGRMGLAYEIIINSDPAIAYCMETNSKTMMMLVIAHASFGHNFFFANNHMFKQHTDAKEILNDLLSLKDYIRECEERYGVSQVEKVLDAAHALKSHGVNRYKRPAPRTPKEEAERRARLEEERLAAVNPVMDATVVVGTGNDAQLKDKWKNASDDIPGIKGEENLLQFIAAWSPHLKPWQREIIKKISDLEQYFYPQRQTKLMNEGCASFWHYTLVTDMLELDLIDDGMYMEFIKSHTGVIAQPDFDSPYYSGINPYALGFAMANDIKRICQEPTAQDREWFPEIAGNEDWVSVLKDSWENYKDESYVRQFLSPKVIEDFKLFVLSDDEDSPMYYEVEAIHNERGYKTVRKALADSYNLGDMEPRIEVESYNFRGDRSVTLVHTMHNNKPLDEKSTIEVMKHFYQLWKHPVILKSVNDAGEVVDERSIHPRQSSNDNKAANNSGLRASP